MLGWPVDEIKNLAKGIVEALNRHDAKKMGERYARDAVLTVIPGAGEARLALSAPRRRIKWKDSSQTN